MGREAATYEIALSADDAAAVVRRLDAAGVEQLGADAERIDFVVRDPNRYWIDLRLHHAGDRRLEIRIALTNDTWSIRAPLESLLTPLPPELAGKSVRDHEGGDVAIAGADRWWLEIESDYERRRDDFVKRIGDFIAPISADHVYMYVHQTRWNLDNDDELAWHREREMAQMQEMWESGEAEGPEV